MHFAEFLKEGGIESVHQSIDKRVIYTLRNMCHLVGSENSPVGSLPRAIISIIVAVT